jgi:hypothetical protein
MHKEFFSSIVTHSYMFRPCWVIFRKNFLLSLHWGCTLQLSENVLLTVYCAVFGGVNSLWSRLALHCSAGPDRREFTPSVHSTNSTAHSHSTVKCNLSVTTESSLWRWPSRVETYRSVLQLKKKLFVHLLVINVFCIPNLLRTTRKIISFPMLCGCEIILTVAVSSQLLVYFIRR